MMAMRWPAVQSEHSSPPTQRRLQKCGFRNCSALRRYTGPMSIEGQKFFPGETATPRQIASLADEYRHAADALLGTVRRGQPLSRAPYRFVAIHALELYLNALLLAAGKPPVALRRMHHDLASRTELAMTARLILRKRTLAHLAALSEGREYLTTRYDPAAPQGSELNRLAATLAEVAEKVTTFLENTPTSVDPTAPRPP
jgi:HEPN domain-containing protein